MGKLLWNPEFIEHINQTFCPTLRQVVTDEYGLTADLVPVIQATDALFPIDPSTREPAENALYRERQEGMGMMVVAIVASLPSVEPLIIRCLENENRVACLAQSQNISEEEMRWRLVQDAVFKQLTGAMLSVVNPQATDKDTQRILFTTEQKCGLR